MPHIQRYFLTIFIAGAILSLSAAAMASSYTFSYNLREGQERTYTFVYPKKDGDLKADMNQISGKAVLCIKRCRIPVSPSDCTCQDLSPNRTRLRCRLQPRARDKGCNWGVRISCATRDCNGLLTIRLDTGAAGRERLAPNETGETQRDNSAPILPGLSKPAEKSPSRESGAPLVSSPETPATGALVRALPRIGSRPTQSAKIEFPSRVRARLPAGNLHWYAFMLEAGVVKIKSGGKLKLKGELYGPGSKLVLKDEAGLDGNNFLLVSRTDKGWHFLKVSRLDTAPGSEYELTLGDGRGPLYVEQGL